LAAALLLCPAAVLLLCSAAPQLFCCSAQQLICYTADRSSAVALTARDCFSLLLSYSPTILPFSSYIHALNAYLEHGCLIHFKQGGGKQACVPYLL
jgi:hypothetical protein